MNILLGIRVALAGGREAVVRMTLMAIGVTVGVVLLLLSLSGLPILQSHIDRLAWHRTDAFSPTTAPDPALWLAVTDRYDGRDVIRVHVAALGPRPPVPPYAMVFVLLVAACSLTISVINGVLERRRPFAHHRQSDCALQPRLHPGGRRKRRRPHAQSRSARDRQGRKRQTPQTPGELPPGLLHVLD